MIWYEHYSSMSYDDDTSLSALCNYRSVIVFPLLEIIVRNWLKDDVEIFHHPLTSVDSSSDV